MAEELSVPVACQLCSRTNYVSLDKYNNATQKGNTYYICLECKAKIPEGKIIGGVNYIDGLIDSEGNFISVKELREIVKS